MGATLTRDWVQLRQIDTELIRGIGPGRTCGHLHAIVGRTNPGSMGMTMQQEVQILTGTLFSLVVFSFIQPVKGMMDKAYLQIGSTQPISHMVELPLSGQPDVAVILRAGTTPGRVEASHAHFPALHLKLPSIQMVIFPMQLRTVALHELTVLLQALHRQAVILASAVKALIDCSDMLSWCFGHLDQTILLIAQYFFPVNVMIARHHEEPLSWQLAALQ
ncbi:hypothetical protein D3C84_417450 [compost metagenome]